jgi:hypothetical protein
MMTLAEVAVELSRRLVQIFLRGDDGRRAVFGDRDVLHGDPLWRDYVPFHEYFHGDTGAGLGASHQTGWTALVGKLLQQSGSKFAGADRGRLWSVDATHSAPSSTTAARHGAGESR